MIFVVYYSYLHVFGIIGYKKKMEMHKHVVMVHVLSQLKDGTHVDRRYAESTIASDISKIMDSMVQKNFVNFLLNQREKKSKWVTEENLFYHFIYLGTMCF